MPPFMEVHNLGDGVSTDDVAKAYQPDLATQGEYDVSYLADVGFARSIREHTLLGCTRALQEIDASVTGKGFLTRSGVKVCHARPPAGRNLGMDDLRRSGEKIPATGQWLS